MAVSSPRRSVESAFFALCRGKDPRRGRKFCTRRGGDLFFNRRERSPAASASQLRTVEIRSGHVCGWQSKAVNGSSQRAQIGIALLGSPNRLRSRSGPDALLIAAARRKKNSPVTKKDPRRDWIESFNRRKTYRRSEIGHTMGRDAAPARAGESKVQSRGWEMGRDAC
jgi:hypothetical protein